MLLCCYADNPACCCTRSIPCLLVRWLSWTSVSSGEQQIFNFPTCGITSRSVWEMHSPLKCVPHKIFGPIPLLSLPLLHCHGVTCASGLKSTPTQWDTLSRTLHNQPFKLRQHSGSRNLTIFLHRKIFAAKVDIDSDSISKICGPGFFFFFYQKSI